MKKMIVLSLCFFFVCTSFTYAQNLLDTNYENRGCDTSAVVAETQRIYTPGDSCYLSNWKSLVGTKPHLVERDTELVFAINFGKRMLVDSLYQLYRDYLQAEFEAPLEKGIWYIFSAEIMADTSSTVGISDFEVFFGKKDLAPILSPYRNKGITPQIKNKDLVTPAGQFAYKSEWRSFERYFRAKGGESYLLIGNFLNHSFPYCNISKKDWDRKTGNLPDANYLVRNIKLTKIPPPENYVNKIPEDIKKGDKLTLSTIEFEVNKSVIQATSYSEVKELSELLKSKAAKVHIIGHTDATGEANHNMKLSNERAVALKKLLMDYGVSAQQISTEGKGETAPLADNATAEGRAQNRRVEIRILNVGFKN